MKQRLLFMLLSLLCVIVGAKAQSGFGDEGGGVGITFINQSSDNSSLSEIILTANDKFVSNSQTSFDVMTVTGAPYCKASFTKGQQYQPTGKPIADSFGVLKLEKTITEPGTYLIIIREGTFQFTSGPNAYSRFETTIGGTNTGGDGGDNQGEGGDNQGSGTQETKQYTFTFTKEGFSQDDRLNVYCDGYRRNEGDIITVNEGVNYGVVINPTSKYSLPKLYNQDGTLLGEPELQSMTDDEITYIYDGTVNSDLNFIVKIEQQNRTLYDVSYTVEGMKADKDEKCYFYYEQDRDRHNSPMTAGETYRLSEEYEIQYLAKCDLSKRKVVITYNDGKAITLADEGDGYWQKGTMRVNEALNFSVVFSNIDGTTDDEQKPELDLTELDKIISDASLYYYSIEKENPDIAATLKQALDEALAVRDGEESTQDDVNTSVKTLNDAYTEAQSAAQKVISTDEFYKAYNAAQAYYEEISSTYSDIAREFYSAYYRNSIDVLWGFAETQKEVNTITAQILKATKKAQDAVAKAKAGYDLKELTNAINEAISYYNNIVDDHAAIAAELRNAINTANETKSSITSQSQIDNAVIDVQNAVAKAMAAVKTAVGEETKKQGLAYITYADESNYRRKQFAYDEQGRTTQALGMVYNSKEDTWDLDTCYVYEYPDQFTTIEYGKIENRYNSTLIGTTPKYSWEWMYKKVTVKTGSAQEVKTYYYDRDNEMWQDEPSDTETTEYDEQGRITKIISKYLLKECTYDGNKKTTTVYEGNDGTSYSPYRKEVEERDANNNVILMERYNYIKGDWMIGDKKEYFYTEDNTYAGMKSYGFSNGVQSYVADDTYRIERDEQNRVVRKIRNKNEQVYSTITYDGYVSTENVGDEKIFIRAVDSEGNITRYTMKEKWGRTEMRTVIDVRYEYDRSVLADDVLGGTVYLREPSQYDYEEPRPDQITYKLKYALAKRIVCGAYKNTETIYSLQPTTVQPAQYDPEAEEPVIVIPIATITDKVDIDDGAVIEIVDEAGNVVYETVVDKSNPEGTNIQDGSVNIKEVHHSYHKPGAQDFDEKQGEEMKDGTSNSRIMAYRYAAKQRVAEEATAVAISTGRYFVQIGGGAVKINGKPVNQISVSLNIPEKPAEDPTDINNATEAVQEKTADTKPAKLILNGRLVIMKNGKLYNINGVAIQ